MNTEDFWADGSSASRQLLLRKREADIAKQIAYEDSWEGQRERENKQRNAIAAYVAGYRREDELGE